MYLKRKIDDYLKNWKTSDEKFPLIVKGARQIGKTASILNFAKENYKNVIYINFVTDEIFRTITKDGYSAQAIVKNISYIDTRMKFIENQTLIIFDEIQEYPEIATSLKFFKEDGRFDVICSGSLLGINYKRIESVSVGYKTDYNMHSLDFEEFLWAKGYSQETVDEMFGHMQDLKPFSDLEMKVFGDLFKDYCVLGGMPKIVAHYIEKGTFEKTLNMQRQLIIDYQEDVRKYADGLEQTRILNVFKHIPVQLSKENKKFQISKVASGARFKDYWGCIDWLNDAGIINICYCMDFPELPLKGNYDPSKYKIYFRDTGLLMASLDDEAQADLKINNNFGVYKGALYENIVAEALVKSGYELYYYKKEDSTLEEDFFVRTMKTLVPVEVKATNGRSKSLRTMIQSPHYPDITAGIKLCYGNIGHENDIYTFPYFCAFLLKRYMMEAEW